MRKFLVFETKHDQIRTEVTNAFIAKSERVINQFNETGKLDETKEALALDMVCPVSMDDVKKIHIKFEQ